MTTLKLRQIGSSVGVVIPKELLAKYKLEKGDELFVVEDPDGIKLSNYDEKTQKQIELARQIMKRRRAALRELAK
ncbi:AbrB/MazE/SpoVT family DNA-binding domain-containing protein [Minwuia thermotolerans]|uniref:AbrB/MazE/SpoVT family DNA-binding domain-containing protein n=1 Tax=Minwuia thermotolerans TaxID=2056226 RepID=A0A2M9G344_9PROT|nr:AbrB/MazE/SpoVT family DNA-binding domain-containing protein [Minwuia thermotolerans]PJK30125.1 AbrB/MazE/SpoVT family DNA-binding domain-containing protein [Minwuia thermotolerans]